MGFGKTIVAGLIVGCALISFAFAADEKQKDVNTSANAPTTAPAADESLKLLDNVAPFAGGEWKIKAKWSDGNPLDARAVYTWGVGKKFIEARTFVNAETGEYQRYLTVFGVHDGKLHAWQFTVDGHADELNFTVDGKKLSSSRPMKTANGSDATLHQSIELTEPNKFHWVVQFETNGQLKPLMDGYWVRESSAASAASARQ